MNEIQMLLDQTENALSEYKEELGDNFPVFVNYHLAARLVKANDQIAVLKKIRFAQMLIKK